MNDQFSSQFPRPPELQPLSPPRNVVWQAISLVLIATGLILLATGGWIFYQYLLEASKPPPARILEVSVPELTETPAPQPSAATVRPTATLSFMAIVEERVTSNSTSPGPGAAALTSDPDIAPVKEFWPAEPIVVPVFTSTPTSPPEATAAPDDVLSLADNPLPVQEEMLTPAATEAAASSAASPAVLPPTRIVAESIGLDAEVVEVGWEQVIQNGVATNVWVVADYAAGWHKNSALPGQGGNIVLSGHHNIKGEVFRYTVDMNVGDAITLYVDDYVYHYLVVDKFIVKDKGEPEAVRRENAKWVGSFNEERLTLVTCWPYTNNTHRAIVIARPVGAAGVE